MEFKDWFILETKISFATGEEVKHGPMDYHGKNNKNFNLLNTKIGMLMENQLDNTNKLEILSF